MEINFIKYYSTCNSKNLTTTANKKALLNKLNSSGSYTQIGNLFTLNDGTSFKASDIPKLNIDSLYEAYAKRNVMDFGSAKYFKYTNSSGKSLAIFSTPKGSLCTPISENILGYSDYDIETERYLHFWNKLKSVHALYKFQNIHLQVKFPPISTIRLRCIMNTIHPLSKLPIRKGMSKTYYVPCL